MKNFKIDTVIFYSILTLGIIGGVTFVYDAYAQDSNVITINEKYYDDTKTYLESGDYTGIFNTNPPKLLDYVDSNNNNVYVDFLHREDIDNIYFESELITLTFNKDLCTISTYDGGKLIGQPIQTTQSHTIKEAINGTDNWNVININDLDCDVDYTINDKGIQIISSKGDFDIIYDVDYTKGFEWTYEYTNNDNTKNNHKYGFTFVCDGIECNDVKIGDVLINEGVTIPKEELQGKGLKIGNHKLDLKEETHGFTWALKKQQNKTIIDFTHSKGALSIDELLQVDPTYEISGGTSNASINTGTVRGFANEIKSGHLLIGEDIFQICFQLKDTGTQTGTLTMGIWDSGDSLQLTYGTHDTSTIGSSYEWVCKENLTGHTLVADDRIGWIIDGSVAGMAGQRSSANADSDLFGRYYNPTTWAAAGDTQDHNMKITYGSDLVGSPGPPINPSGTGLPFANNFTWEMSNNTQVTGSAIWNSTDNVTFDWLVNVSNGTESYLHEFLGINEEMYYKVSHFSLNNGTNSTAYSISTDNYPDVPSVTSHATGETQNTITYDSAGASDGGDLVKDYNLQASVNSGPWLDLVSNSTIVTQYNHTGLSGGDVVDYGWRDGNGVGWSVTSSNSSSTTYADIVANLIINNGNVGDVINATGTLTVTTSSPKPVTIDTLELIRNGTIVGTVTPTNSLNIETEILTPPVWYPITNDNYYEYWFNATLTNGIDTTEITSNVINITRIYDPDYFPGIDTPAQLVNYTISRETSDMTLNFNRDIGGTWQAECLYANLAQALAGDGEGTWDNQTDIGYYTDNQNIGNTETVYIACYNDDLLFTTTSYSNSTNSLVLGLSIFDDLGGLFGAPSVLLIILAVATMATGRNAPTMLVVLLTVIGIVGALGMLVLEAEVWGILVVAGAIGIFQVRRLF